MTGLLLIIATLLSTAPSANPKASVQAPDYIRLTLEDGPSLFSTVEYHLQTVGGAVVGCSVHAYTYVEREQIRCGLFEPGAVESMWRELGPEGLDSAAVPVSGSPLASTWRFDGCLGGRCVDLKAEVLDMDSAFSGLAEGFMRLMDQQLGKERFLDFYALEQKAGSISLWTRPRTMLWLDGTALERRTPVLGLDLPAGRHRIRLYDEERGIDRAGTVEVSPGRNTNYFIDLLKEE